MLKKIDCVLLVDDSEATNNYNRRIIESLDLANRIEIALNGRLALDYIIDCDENKLPNLILLDINMPMLNGFQFIEEYQKLDEGKKKSIVIMMLTTSISEEDKKKSEQFNEISYYLNKPLSEEQITEIWKRYFGESTTHIE